MPRKKGPQGNEQEQLVLFLEIMSFSNRILYIYGDISGNVIEIITCINIVLYTVSTFIQDLFQIASVLHNQCECCIFSGVISL